LPEDDKSSNLTIKLRKASEKIVTGRRKSAKDRNLTVEAEPWSAVHLRAIFRKDGESARCLPLIEVSIQGKGAADW
jgi:hypothetical protein